MLEEQYGNGEYREDYEGAEYDSSCHDTVPPQKDINIPE